MATLLNTIEQTSGSGSIDSILDNEHRFPLRCNDTITNSWEFLFDKFKNNIHLSNSDWNAHLITKLKTSDEHQNLLFIEQFQNLEDESSTLTHFVRTLVKELDDQVLILLIHKIFQFEVAHSISFTVINRETNAAPQALISSYQSLYLMHVLGQTIHNLKIKKNIERHTDKFLKNCAETFQKNKLEPQLLSFYTTLLEIVDQKFKNTGVKHVLSMIFLRYVNPEIINAKHIPLMNKKKYDGYFKNFTKIIQEKVNNYESGDVPHESLRIIATSVLDRISPAQLLKASSHEH